MCPDGRKYRGLVIRRFTRGKENMRTLFNIRSSAVALALMMLLPTGATAQWVQASGSPYAGDIESFAISGTDIFLACWGGGGAGGGVYRSTDNGTTWTAINTGLTSRNVSSVAVIGSNLFAGTIRGVFRSTNCGASWMAVNTGLTTTDIAALGVSGTNLFAGTCGGGAFVSSNDGASWTAVNTGLTGTYVWCFTASGSDLFAGTDSGAFRSTNDGASWTAINSGLTDSMMYQCVYDFAASGAHLFAATCNGVFMSTNSGTHWTPVNGGLPDDFPASALVVNGTDLIMASEWIPGIFRSTNNGTSWSALNTAGIDSYLYSFAVCPDGAGGTQLLVGGGFGRIYRSTDNGAHWAVVSTGLMTAGVYALAVIPNGTGGKDIVAGGSGGTFRSTDKGASWTRINGRPADTLACGDVHVLAISNAALFAGTDSGVFRSTDNGSSWTPLHAGSTSPCISALAISSTTLFAGSWGGGVFRSTGDCTSWTAVNTGLADSVISALAVRGPNVLAATSDQYGGGRCVYRSTNNGNSWTAVNFETMRRVEAFAVTNTSIFAATWGDGIFRSTDNGTNWTAFNMGLMNEYGALAVYDLAVSGTHLFAGTSVGVYLSTDNGTSWVPVNTGRPAEDACAFAITETDLYVGGSGGVWRRPLSEMITTVEQEESEVPRESSLFQNYPNPFNPNSDIRYQISEFGMVRLAVYDLLGREVAVLVNEAKAPGTYQVRFDGAGLPSGVYFYRMAAGSFSATKRALLLK
jgi:hypothetical protein